MEIYICDKNGNLYMRQKWKFIYVIKIEIYVAM